MFYKQIFEEHSKKKETQQIKHLYLTNFYKMIFMSNEKESLTLNLKLLLMVDSKI